MSAELHPIQAEAPQYAPVIVFREVTYYSAFTVGRFVSVFPVIFMFGVAGCTPCVKLLPNPWGTKDVIDIDIPRPPEHKQAEEKMRALGVVPSIVFPEGVVTPKGERKSSKKERDEARERKVAEAKLDESNLDKFNHFLFREPLVEYDPNAVDKCSKYSNAAVQAFVDYTICLPVTVARKTKSCGCGDQEVTAEYMEEYISGMIQGIVEIATDKPNAPCRKYAAKAFEAGCWDGPAFVNCLAPIVNEQVNTFWLSVLRFAYKRETLLSDGLADVLESPGFTPELERDVVMKMKCLIMEMCVENCNKSSNAWDTTNAKAAAKSVGSWLWENVSTSDVIEAVTSI